MKKQSEVVKSGQAFVEGYGWLEAPPGMWNRWLVHTRHFLGLSQGDMAVALGLGSHGYQRMEKGASHPDYWRKLGVTVSVERMVWEAEYRDGACECCHYGVPCECCLIHPSTLRRLREMAEKE